MEPSVYVAFGLFCSRPPWVSLWGHPPWSLTRPLSPFFTSSDFAPSSPTKTARHVPRPATAFWLPLFPLCQSFCRLRPVSSFRLTAGVKPPTLHLAPRPSLDQPSRFLIHISFLFPNTVFFCFSLSSPHRDFSEITPVEVPNCFWVARSSTLPPLMTAGSLRLSV